MSKKALDLDYMKDALNLKTGLKVGATFLYGLEPPDEPPYIIYGVQS